MTALSILTAAVEAPTRLNPLELFMDADIVVQAVMLGLILASIWVWMIIISFSLRLAGVKKRCADFEGEFWQADDFDALVKERSKKNIPSARVAAAGMSEWRRSMKVTGGKSDRDGIRQRLAGAMESQVAQEADTLADRLNFLATTGSVAPFVGLFGTVWGIMNSFFQIGVQENSSLAVVAPGISEALFATAIGLFAAIPAVIAYNRFSHGVNSLEAKMQRFADRFHASLSRELERQ
ncbi:protein TolQ [Pontixanthobacter aestiaquae]|uniref:Protein TolQ n=1 Tax=Pontixanthobacter aestiaquae TaxID=1509367 RepID=A0A844Z6J5_9SPHN|nr:protein TolQ [Pontixanthobacter aestiaquae]MDN3646312.1 protein TolQ [Pontixanthobacter aestiaquae]MXO82697.1 protein TolQ [Pontixanthobacter aestiaquae]